MGTSDKGLNVGSIKILSTKNLAEAMWLLWKTVSELEWALLGPKADHHSAVLYFIS